MPPGEPLHDIINAVQNQFTELPYHISNPDTLNDFEKFSIATIGDKNQQKGSDARLFAVKLPMFAHLKFMEKNKWTYLRPLHIISKNNIYCYSPYEQRTQKNILRLYNLCFKFRILTITINSIPKTEWQQENSMFPFSKPDRLRTRNLQIGVSTLTHSTTRGKVIWRSSQHLIK